MSRRRYNGITMGAVGAVKLAQRGIGQFDWTSLLNPAGLGYDIGREAGNDLTRDVTNATVLTPLSDADARELTVVGSFKVNVNDALNLRSTAEVRSDNILAQMSRGEIVQVLDRADGIFVMVRRANGQTGWAAANSQDGSKKYLVSLQQALDPLETQPVDEGELDEPKPKSSIFAKAVGLLIPVAGGLLAYKHSQI